MADIERMKSYLRASAAKEAAEASRERRPEQPFVTISRQAGAGGHSLADAVLSAMNRDGRPFLQGWHIFDNELFEMVAADPELSVLVDSFIDEEFRSSFEDYLAQSVAGLSPQAAVFKKVFKIIRGLAAGGRAVIVGRGGCCVTADMRAGIHIRLAAPQLLRQSSIMKRYGLDAFAARKKMEALDESRRSLVRNYFSKDIDDPLLYHAVFNMGAVSLDAAARLIINMVAEKSRSLLEPASAFSR